DAAGNSATATAVPATVSNTDTTPPTISAVNAANPSSSGVTITWLTNEVSDSQVEYGTTSAYGSLSTPNTSLVTSHSQPLTGLQSSTLFHYRVKSKDAAGNLAVSADFMFSTASSAPVLIGDQAIEATQDSNNGGVAEAFQYTAPITGSATAANVYLDSANAATQV